jgi:hypothetical protein
MDLAYEIFSLVVYIVFLIVSVILVFIKKKELAIIPSLFISIAIYSLSYNGLLAGFSLMLLTLIFIFV